MFRQGDRVVVQGFGSKEAVLRVWETRERGLLLCPEESYQQMLRGEEGAVIGFPMGDIRGLYENHQEANHHD
ncbi:MAG: hypothetical protein Q8O76_09050 [Chloroflexota bacterium]|nr:hypothetical protein [Chloroflexota bacterium]